MAITGSTITPTTAAKMIGEVWTREIEKPFYNELYARDLVTDRSALVRGGGSKVNIPFMSTYNARSKVAGTEVTYDANTETEVELTINKHKYLAFLLEEITKVQSNYNLAQAYRQAQAEALARALDTDLLSLYSSATTTVTGGAAIDDADILAVIYALDAANVPQTNRFGIVGSKEMSDLRAVNKYVAYDQTGKTGLAASNGAIVASVYGIDIAMSNNIVDDLTLRHSLFGHKSALSLAVQLAPTYKVEESADYLGTKFVLHTVYGVAAERPGALVNLTRAS